MRIKLHKGPMHGKTYEVRDGERDIVLRHINSAGMLMSYGDPSPTAHVDIQTVTYRMKVMSHPNWGTFPCVDPDGRVFFEYVR